MNTPGQNTNDVAELVFAMMLNSARNSFDGTCGFEVADKSIAFYMGCQSKDEGVVSASSLHAGTEIASRA